MHTHFLLIWVAILFAGVTHVAAENLRRLSIDDIIGMKRVLSVQISPDGRHIAYVTEEPAAELSPSKQWSTTLWVTTADGKETHRLKLDKISSPQWSAD